jgi:hypothetical protein
MKPVAAAAVHKSRKGGGPEHGKPVQFSWEPESWKDWHPNLRQHPDLRYRKSIVQGRSVSAGPPFFRASPGSPIEE